MGQYQHSDPIIELTFDYPNGISLASSASQSGSFTVKNKSKLPLFASNVTVTANDTIDGYDLQLLDNGSPVSGLPFSIGPLAAGATSGSQPFKFRIQKVVMHPPTNSDPTISFNFLPSYQIKYQKTDSLHCPITTIIRDGSGGNTYSGTKTYTCSTDPVISFSGRPATPVTYNTLHPNSAGFGCTVSVTNNAELPLTDIVMQYDVDDTSSHYHTTVKPSEDLHALGAGKSTSTTVYWGASLDQGASPEPEEFTTTLKIMPWYTVQYSRSDEIFSTGQIPVSQ